MIFVGNLCKMLRLGAVFFHMLNTSITKQLSSDRALRNACNQLARNK